MKQSNDHIIMKHVIIIGGGIAGLTAAHHLKRQKVAVTLLERDNSVGGAIKTVLRNDRYLLELGPNTFLGSSDPIFELARELEIDRHLVQNDSKKRFVFRNEKLHEVPIGPKEFLFSPVLSRKGRLRVLFEPFVRRKSEGSESLAAFVTRRAGKELLEALVDPFVSGVYAGDPFQLEIKSVFPRLVEIENQYGSIFKGMRHLKGTFGKNRLLSFLWGMQTLPSRLHDLMEKEVRTHSAAEAILPAGNGRWAVLTDSRGEEIVADAVVIATPAHEAARLLMPHAHDIFSSLMGIPYVSLAVVHAVFRRSEIPRDLDGFGFLIPRREKVRLLGSIWSSALFPNRAPNGETLLTCFVGGATDPFAIDLDDQDILTHVRQGLEQTMSVRAEPRFYNITRISQAIPQYTIGHSARLSEIERCMKSLPGVFLTGSYFTGISVADTIVHSKKTAASAVKWLCQAP